MSKLNATFDADLLLCLLSHFEYDAHTVHMFIQQPLLPPLTRTVKLSLFTHVHSSSPSLAARLHPCHTNCSYILTMAGLFLDRPHTYLQNRDLNSFVSIFFPLTITLFMNFLSIEVMWSDLN